jgi:Zn-dependent M28 family amino/carboxypeptidase
MLRRTAPLLAALALAACATDPLARLTPAERWWSHVTVLAHDDMEGRNTGTPGYDRAAVYVADQFRRAGLRPAGTDGYLQPIPFVVQRVLPDRSSVSLVQGGTAKPLTVGQDLTLGARIPQTASLPDAPLHFIGYGLHAPEAGHDDFAGQDLRGKVAVVLSGGPSSIPGPLRAHAGNDRWRHLQAAGAVGLITVANPKSVEIPWARARLNALQPQMRHQDPAMNPVQGTLFTAALNPDTAPQLLARSGRTFPELLALADAGEPLPRFALNQSVRATVAAETSQVTSPNVVGLLPGSDPKLKSEYVVLTAHLDGLGVGEPVDGDRINNGAMDNASGIASLIEQARALRAGPKPKRSVLFVAVTAEEKGLLGSQYFAERPTVPKSALAANVNMDMFMPIRPATSMLVLGETESTLGEIAREAAAATGVTLVPDPAPAQGSFTRSDQYSFIRTGVPALSAKIGYRPSTPEAAADRAWRSTRYHGPADDLSQPFDREAAVGFNTYMAELIRRVADAPERPRWLSTSFFRRFATPENAPAS